MEGHAPLELKVVVFFCQEPPEVLYVEAPTLYTTKFVSELKICI